MSGCNEKISACGSLAHETHGLAGKDKLAKPDIDSLKAGKEHMIPAANIYNQ